MSVLGDVRAAARLAAGLGPFLRDRITPKRAREILRERMDQREDRFLRLLERGVFGHARSPYRALLEHAGCSLGDVRDLVRSRGIEAALEVLRGAGVFVGFEEFKGRRPIVRGSLELATRPEDFDNPFSNYAYFAETGGTTGAGTRVGTELDHLAERAPYFCVAFESYGVLGAPQAVWRGPLPASAALNTILTTARFGDIPERWFSPYARGDLRAARKHALAQETILRLARLSGARIPSPETVRMDDAVVVARWAAEALSRHGSCYLAGSISMSLRVCLAAEGAGMRLDGAVFSGGGEPVTAAKVAGLARVGAVCRPGYGFTEAGVVGMSCGTPERPNDQHLLADSFALLCAPQETSASQAFHFTTLSPTTPKILINTEVDDCGFVDRRSCGCALDECGFDTHLVDIHSVRKLNLQGGTVDATEVQRILQEAFPARFGGDALAYQLVQEEGDDGFTRLVLRVSPRVQANDDGAFATALTEEVRRLSLGADLSGEMWRQAGALCVRREEPVWSGRGKLGAHLQAPAQRRS